MLDGQGSGLPNSNTLHHTYNTMPDSGSTFDTRGIPGWSRSQHEFDLPEYKNKKERE